MCLDARKQTFPSVKTRALCSCLQSEEKASGFHQIIQNLLKSWWCCWLGSGQSRATLIQCLQEPRWFQGSHGEECDHQSLCVCVCVCVSHSPGKYAALLLLRVYPEVITGNIAGTVIASFTQVAKNWLMPSDSGAFFHLPEQSLFRLHSHGPTAQCCKTSHFKTSAVTWKLQATIEEYWPCQRMWAHPCLY